jgi:hypothetical protein
VAEPAVIRPLTAGEAREGIGVLSEILIDCLKDGASVSFMTALARAKGKAFWRGVSDGGAAGASRSSLPRTAGAARSSAPCSSCSASPRTSRTGPMFQDAGPSCGPPAGARHRADGAVEEAAPAAGKTLLVLDTAGAEAERLSERAGWIRGGVVPG